MVKKTYHIRHVWCVYVCVWAVIWSRTPRRKRRRAKQRQNDIMHILSAYSTLSISIYTYASIRCSLPLYVRRSDIWWIIVDCLCVPLTSSAKNEIGFGYFVVAIGIGTKSQANSKHGCLVDDCLMANWISSNDREDVVRQRNEMDTHQILAHTHTGK